MNDLRMKYFVFKPKGDDAYAEASRMAIRAYAHSIGDEIPELRDELLQWVDDETPALNDGLGALLPCPFCGGKARSTAHLAYSWFAPVCNSCGARGPSVSVERGASPQKMRELLNEADALWNIRALTEAQFDEHCKKLDQPVVL